MPTEQGDSQSRPGALSWPFARAGLPLLYLWLAWSWWFEIRAQVQVAAEMAPTMDADTMATLGLGARALATLSEAGIYTLWWRSRGLRLPYWRFQCWVAALSATDLVGYSLRRAAEDAPVAIRVIAAVLAGPGALESPSAGGSGGMAGFGSLGILTVVRVAMTAWAQAQGIGRTVSGPLMLTASAWLLTRLIGWWSVDLMKGLSPVP
jgi:hypothetical protein